MSTQPEALRLIDHLNNEWREDWDGLALRDELRRLHELNQQLLAALNQSFEDVWNTAIEATYKEMIEKAVLAEREACAKVCDDIDVEYDGEDVLATWCAKIIRARSNT